MGLSNILVALNQKALDGVALNQKRKLATRCVACLTEVSTPTNLVVKQMRLVGDEGQPKILISYLLLPLSKNFGLWDASCNVSCLLTNTRRGPTSPWLPFPMLFASIRSRVPSKPMLLIKAHYIQFKACQVAAANTYVLSDEISLKHVIHTLPLIFP